MNTDQTPKLGGAMWLLKGARLPEIAAWMANQGFAALSLHPFILKAETPERQDLAAAVRDLGLSITYHGNIIRETQEKGSLDYTYLDRQIDDCLWWHEHATRVTSLLFDSIHLENPAGFAKEMNRDMVLHTAERLGTSGIRTGIENIFGAQENYQSLADIRAFKESCNLPDMGILLDTGHTNVHVRSGIDPNIRDIGSFIKGLPLDILEVHLQDNQGKKDEHKYLGYGTLDLKALLNSLKGIKYKGPLTLEICKDILSGQYQIDINVPEEADLWLRSRDILLTAWEVMD